MIRVIVVDDSTFMRRAITSLLELEQDIKVVATAPDGQAALQIVDEVEADVMTLDVEMPRLGGLETLQRLMKTNPMPVLMISSLTESGAESTLKALEYGALDFIPKIMSNEREVFGAELRRKVRALARRKAIIRLKYRRINHIPAPQPRWQPSQPADYVQTPCLGPRDLVVIGVSTGGPPVVQKILSSLPADLPACILVAQHMPATFTGPFAKRLDNVCQIDVSEAVDGDKFKIGHAYVCPGGKHIGIRMRGPLPEVSVTEEPRDALYKPTVNLLMETAGPWAAAPWASCLRAWARTAAKAHGCCEKKAAASSPRMRPPVWSTACPRPWWTPNWPTLSWMRTTLPRPSLQPLKADPHRHRTEV